MPLGVQSGYRSEERQARLWHEALDKYGSADEARKWVAPPGRSMHNHGQAADLNYGGGGLGKGNADLIQWAHDNANAYGLTFPLSNENWHIEPIGARASSRPHVDIASNPAAISGAGNETAGPAMGLTGPADLHSLVDVMRSNNPIERRSMLSGMEDYTMNSFLADEFAGTNPLRRMFYGSIAKLLA